MRKPTEFLYTAKSTYKNRMSPGTIAAVQIFFERDDVSRMCAGKKETVTRSKVTKQKRYLLDNMRNLHKKFVAMHPGDDISSSSSFYFANVKHRQQQVADAIVAGQQGSKLH